MLYVSHDIEEVSQLADHLILLDQGHLVGQGSLLDLCTRLDTRLSHEEQAAAIAQCTITRHDADFGLTELDLEGQPLLVSHLSQAPGQARRVRIPARDVSVCRQRPTDSSILNILPVTLTEIEETSRRPATAAPVAGLPASAGQDYAQIRASTAITGRRPFVRPG